MIDLVCLMQSKVNSFILIVSSTNMARAGGKTDSVPVYRGQSLPEARVPSIVESTRTRTYSVVSSWKHIEASV